VQNPGLESLAMRNEAETNRAEIERQLRVRVESLKVMITGKAHQAQNQKSGLKTHDYFASEEGNA